jgi:hypothetical protein
VGYRSYSDLQYKLLACVTLTVVALRAIYPEYKWDEVPFKKYANIHPYGHWRSIKNQRLFMDQLAKTLNLKTMDDWYYVKKSQVIQHGGQGILDHYGSSLSKGVSYIIPFFNTN